MCNYLGKIDLNIHLLYYLSKTMYSCHINFYIFFVIKFVVSLVFFIHLISGYLVGLLLFYKYFGEIAKTFTIFTTKNIQTNMEESAIGSISITI